MLEIKFPSSMVMEYPAMVGEALEPCLKVPVGQPIMLDLTDLQKISAFGAAAFAARMMWLIRSRRMPSGSTIRRPNNNRVSNDLMRMGLYNLAQEGSERVFKSPDPLSRPQELWLIDRLEDLEENVQRLCLMLRKILAVDEEIFNRVGGMMMSLGQNVFRHASSPSGAVLCGQAYPKAGILEFAMADTGCGVRSALNQVLEDKLEEDAQALLVALSSKVHSSEGPRPSALSRLTATAKQNKGELVILSGTASLGLRGGEMRAQANKIFPGTVVGMRLNLVTNL